MAIAKKLDEVHPSFIQDCPFCSRPNRIVVHGLWVMGDKVQKHPDMGYSFCNCKNMFYTNEENVSNPVNYQADERGYMSLPDPFFAWPDPYQFLHWDVRKYRIIWPMDSLCEDLKYRGFEILEAYRDFDINSKTPQHYHIRVSR